MFEKTKIKSNFLKMYTETFKKNLSLYLNFF